MIKKKYIKSVQKIIQPYSKNQQVKFFIFGSSIKKQKFGDVDIGVTGKITEKEIAELKEKFKISDLPYFIDVINFNKAEKEFKNNVLNNEIIWLKP